MTSDSTVCSTLQKYSATRVHPYVGLHTHCGPTFLLTSDMMLPHQLRSEADCLCRQSRGGLAVQVSSHATVLVSDVACTKDYVEEACLFTHVHVTWYTAGIDRSRSKAGQRN